MEQGEARRCAAASSGAQSASFSSCVRERADEVIVAVREAAGGVAGCPICSTARCFGVKVSTSSSFFERVQGQ